MVPEKARPLLLLALTCMGAAGPAWAQGQGDHSADATPPSPVTRVFDIFGPDAAPVRPLVGVVVPGSGPAAGALVEWRSIARSPLGAGGEALLSVRNYQHLLVRAGYLANRRGLPDLRPADAGLPSFMDPGRRHTGAALYVEHRYRRLPRLSYFALSGPEPLRTDFGETRTTTDLVAQWAGSPSVGGAVRIGVMTTGSFDGTDDRRPNTHDAFGRALADGVVRRTRYVTAGAGVVVDRRDVPAHPTAGWMVQAAATGFGSTTANVPSFVRLALDTRVHRRLAVERHTLAGQVLVAADLAGRGRAVPYHLQQTLGGSSTLRAYDSYRLRGSRLIHLSLESRWQVASRLELAPFVDAGRVDGGHLASGLTGWLLAPGLGLRLRYSRAVAGRVDVARGREGYRVAYAFDAVF